MFVLRFNGGIYHQFAPVDPAEDAYFAVSVHSNEAAGLSGELLNKVLSKEGSIPLLTEPASDAVLNLLADAHADAYKMAGITAKDGRYVVFMGDDERYEYIYRFITKGKVSDKNPDLLFYPCVKQGISAQ